MDDSVSLSSSSLNLTPRDEEDEDHEVMSHGGLTLISSLCMITSMMYNTHFL